MQCINKQLIEKVVDQAQDSPRKRMNLNFHETYDATLQRMLNAMEPDTYIQPHKHEDPDKAEIFIVLQGRVLVAEFDDRGNVIASCVLSFAEGVYGVEISPRVWHCIVPLEPATVIYEVKDGPYSPLNDKNFASWAPKEGTAGCMAYRDELLKRCGIG
jgi:cupin fold WbuC family metalloprotein